MAPAAARAASACSAQGGTGGGREVRGRLDAHGGAEQQPRNGHRPQQLVENLAAGRLGAPGAGQRRQASRVSLALPRWRPSGGTSGNSTSTAKRSPHLVIIFSTSSRVRRSAHSTSHLSPRTKRNMRMPSRSAHSSAACRRAWQRRSAAMAASSSSAHSSTWPPDTTRADLTLLKT